MFRLQARQQISCDPVPCYSPTVLVSFVWDVVGGPLFSAQEECLKSSGREEERVGVAELHVGLVG